MTPTVNFNDYNSYSFFNMVLYDYTVSDAVRETNFIKVPGRSGKLDVTDYFGEVYEDRDINIIFNMKDSIDNLPLIQSRLSNTINGKRMRLVFSNDAGYYWDARITKIKTTKLAKNMIEIKVDAVAYPYKINLITGEEVL